MPARDYYIDRLRSVMTVLVILHHTALTYGAIGGWFWREVQPSRTPFSRYFSSDSFWRSGVACGGINCATTRSRSQASSRKTRTPTRCRVTSSSSRKRPTPTAPIIRTEVTTALVTEATS